MHRSGYLRTLLRLNSARMGPLAERTGNADGPAVTPAALRSAGHDPGPRRRHDATQRQSPPLPSRGRTTKCRLRSI